MIPAKLLGLPLTEDSIVVHAADAAWRALPRILPQRRHGAEEHEPSGSRKVLRSLIALRKRGEK